MILLLFSSTTFARKLTPNDKQILDDIRAKGYSKNIKMQKLKSDDSPMLDVFSDRAVIAKRKKSVTFSGNVFVLRDVFKLSADKLYLEYLRGDSIIVKSIEAKDNVRFVTRGFNASSDAAIYSFSDNKIILKDNLSIAENKIRIFATEFSYNVVSREIDIGSSNENVSVVFDAAIPSNSSSSYTFP